MKVLFVTHPMLTHLLSMIPVADSMKRMGHEIYFASGKSFAPVINSFGFQSFEAGYDHDGHSRLFDALLNRGEISGRYHIPEWFAAEAASAMIADLIDITRNWKADLIVRTPVELASIIAADVCDIPQVSICWAFPPGKTFIETFWQPHYSDLRRTYGLTSDDELERFYPYTILSSMPSSWHDFDETAYSSLESYSFFAPNDLFEMPDLSDISTNLPWVHLTFGATWAHKGHILYEQYAQQVSGDKFISIATSMNRIEIEKDILMRKNIFCYPFLAHDNFLNKCKLMIFHGGFNTFQQAAAFGLPMLITPLNLYDQPEISHRAQNLGIAHELKFEHFSDVDLETMIQHMLDDQNLNEASKCFSHELVALPNIDVFSKTLDERF